jgi:membrane protease YdiL (CAAX protease family)
VADHAHNPADRRRHFRLTDVAVGYVIATILANIGMGVLTKAQAPDSAIFLGGMLGLWLGLVGTVLFVSSRRATRNFPQDFLVKVKKRDVVPCFLLGIVCQLLVVPVIYMVLGVFIDVSTFGDVAEDLFGDYGMGWNAVLLVLGLVVVAPIVEELFYRGLLLQALLERMPRKAATVVAAFLFGLVHFRLLQFPGLFAFGLVAAMLMERTNRLGPSVLAHMGFNAASLVSVVLVS